MRDRAELGRARARLKWDEAFVLQVELARRRVAAEALAAVPRKPDANGLLADFDEADSVTITGGAR